MRTCYVITTSLVILFLTLSVLSDAVGGQIEIQLNGLLGEYQLNSYNPNSIETDPLATRTANLSESIHFDNVERINILLEGEMAFGEIMGDGVLRESRTVPLRGVFSPTLILGSTTFFELVPPASQAGLFSRSVKLFDIQHSLSGSWPPDFLASNFRSVKVGLIPGAYDITLDIPYIGTPPFPNIIPDFNGINFTSPLTGRITKASLVLEGAEIPEPNFTVWAPMLLILLGVLALFRSAPLVTA